MMRSEKYLRECFLKINYGRIVCLTFFSLLLFFPCIQANAQKKSSNDSVYIFENLQSKFEIGGGYSYPTRFSNKIQTITIDGFYRKKRFKDVRMLVNLGLTANYAWGYSRQWEPLNDSIFVAYDYQTFAFGIGPVLQISPTIIKTKRFSVTAEANGGILVYNKKFPYGGDFYNFIFRTGPSLIYILKNNRSMKIGARWMHVSNGKGYGNQNPFYEALGISVGVLIEK